MSLLLLPFVFVHPVVGVAVLVIPMALVLGITRSSLHRWSALPRSFLVASAILQAVGLTGLGITVLLTNPEERAVVTAATVLLALCVTGIAGLVVTGALFVDRPTVGRSGRAMPMLRFVPLAVSFVWIVVASLCFLRLPAIMRRDLGASSIIEWSFIVMVLLVVISLLALRASAEGRSSESRAFSAVAAVHLASSGLIGVVVWLVWLVGRGT